MVKPFRIGLYGLSAVALIGIGAAIGASGASGQGSAAPAPTVTVTAPAAAAAPAVTVTVTAKPAVAAKPSDTMPGDGTFIVGYAAGDWKSGTWQTGTPDSGNCYSSTLSNLSGSGDASGIIQNNNSAGPTVMAVTSGAKGVQVSGCNEWHKVG